ncbi:MAG: hypothetical protein NC548_20595 [Lachnospiraceae bacterium]|nr:hypothetical protein [Lachnospiraceae bacterium]
MRDAGEAGTSHGTALALGKNAARDADEAGSSHGAALALGKKRNGH